MTMRSNRSRRKMRQRFRRSAEPSARRLSKRTRCYCPGKPAHRAIRTLRAKNLYGGIRHASAAARVRAFSGHNAAAAAGGTGDQIVDLADAMKAVLTGVVEAIAIAEATVVEIAAVGVSNGVRVRAAVDIAAGSIAVITAGMHRSGVHNSFPKCS